MTKLRSRHVIGCDEEARQATNVLSKGWQRLRSPSSHHLVLQNIIISSTIWTWVMCYTQLQFEDVISAGII